MRGRFGESRSRTVRAHSPGPEVERERWENLGPDLGLEGDDIVRMAEGWKVERRVERR